jgi:threonine dehydratase
VALRALRPHTTIYAAEVATAAPLSVALSYGEVHTIEYQPSFVDGIGSTMVFPRMWEYARGLIDGSLVQPEQAAKDAVRLLAERQRIIAEGAAACAVAAALSGEAEAGKIVCIVSGGNLDFGVLSEILSA